MPQNAPPKVFVSATSADLRTSRLLVKDALLKIGCHPDDQDDFPPDWRSVTALLETKIADCAALIHIVGLRYGAEPDPTTLPPDAVRRSYTQLEYDLACRLQEERGDSRFRVYVFVCPEDYAYDVGTEPESEEQQATQRAHRAALLANARRYEEPATPPALKERILALREPMLALQQEQAAVQTEVRRSHKTLLVVLALVALLLAGGWVGYRRLDTGMTTVSQGLTVDAPRIKTHLREASERTLATALEAANKESTSEARERQREAAKAAHEIRLLRIDDVAASFAALAGQPDANPIMQEMSRILQDEGVDAALAYAEKKRPEILNAFDAAQAAYQEKIRAQLQPLLKAAQLHAARGDSDAARQGYAELFARLPEWPELLRAFGWFVCDRSDQAEVHGGLRAARADAAHCLDLAHRWQTLTPNQPLVLRLLAAANHAMGDVIEQSNENGAVTTALQHHEAALAYTEARYRTAPEDMEAARDLLVSLNKLADLLTTRGHSGDAQQALTFYQRDLEIGERIFAANPDNTQAMRDVSVSLSNLGNFLAVRGQPSDAQQVLAYYQRSFEINERLLAAHPDSAQAARDVSVSLSTLADLLTTRGASGDVRQQARIYYERSLEISERLLAANPDSALAARDVSVCLNKLGSSLATGGQSSDVQHALTYHQRSLEISERLLAANPDSARVARDVSFGLNKLGDFLAARGQSGYTQQAQIHYERGLEIRERLLAANPDSAQAARDVSVNLNTLGNLLAVRGQSGDAQQALKYYTRSLEISEPLLAANPESAQAARDVSVSLGNLGKLLWARGQSGDAQQALAYYQRDLEIGERLLADDPSDTQVAHEVSAKLNIVGDLLAARGQSSDAQQAVTYYQRSLEVSERLLAADPDITQSVRNAMVSLERLADAQQRQRGNADRALTLQIRALGFAERLRARNPDSAFYGQTLAVSQSRTAFYAHAADDEALARKYRAACLATLDELVSAGAELDEPMRRFHTELNKARSSQ